MRYLFIILTIFTAFTVNAQVFVGGSGAMEPTGDFPVAFSNNVKGAPKRVNSLAQRNAIPAALRDTGMTCYVTSIDSTYILRGGIDNTNWQTYSTGGGGTTIISNGGGNIVTRTVTATGLRKDIAVYTGTGVVGSVQPITINGGGMIYFFQNGDSTYIHYSQAPKGDITYKISIIGEVINGLINCNPVNYGALFANNTNIDAGANLGLAYLRAGYSGGNTSTYLNLTNAGYRVLLTYNHAVSVIGNYTPFPTDTMAFKNRLDSFLATNGTTNLEGITLINEPNNIRHGMGYWQPNARAYINLLKASIPVAHKYGIKIGDGGFTGEILYYMVQEDYINRGFPDSAADFAARAFPNTGGLSNWRTDTGHGYRIAFVDSVLTAIAALDVDFVNFHYYEHVLDKDSTADEINPETFKQIAKYLRRVTGKPVITNEFGINNNVNPLVMDQLIDAVEDLHAQDKDMMQYAMWYSGNQNYLLADASGIITELGQAFRNKISDQRADIISILQ